MLRSNGDGLQDMFIYGRLFRSNGTHLVHMTSNDGGLNSGIACNGCSLWQGAMGAWADVSRARASNTPSVK